MNVVTLDAQIYNFASQFTTKNIRYSHRIVSMGALVTVMIATSGDEAFVLFAMMPKEALLLTIILFFISILVGVITDWVAGKVKALRSEEQSVSHMYDIPHCSCFPKNDIIDQLRNCSLARGVLIVTLFCFVIFLLSGISGLMDWDWKKITILSLTSIAIFIVLTVPDHFLEEHLWEHVAKKHIIKIFLWTLGAFFIIHIITDYMHLEGIIKKSQITLIMIAGLLGIIPESGPHLLFVTLYAKRLIPFVVLLVSSIVQDGHGMLPLLGFSRKVFIIVKLINLLAGLLVGTLFMLISMYGQLQP